MPIISNLCRKVNKQPFFAQWIALFAGEYSKRKRYIHECICRPEYKMSYLGIVMKRSKNFLFLVLLSSEEKVIKLKLSFYYFWFPTFSKWPFLIFHFILLFFLFFFLLKSSILPSSYWCFQNSFSSSSYSSYI